MIKVIEGPKKDASDTTPTVSVNAVSDSSKKEPDQKKWKLTMNNQLQSALVTNTNLTPQQFQAFWNECEADADDAVARL